MVPLRADIARPLLLGALLAATGACGATRRTPAPVPAPRTVVREAPPDETRPAPVEPERADTNPLLSEFLRALAPRIGASLYVRSGSSDQASIYCGERARGPICEQCYAHGFDSECGPGEQQLLCGHVGPYGHPPANVTRVRCAPDGTSCWLDLAPLGNAPAGSRVTWFFEPGGPLEALVYTAPGAPASLDTQAAVLAMSAACGFDAALREGPFFGDHVGVFVHHWSSESDGPRHDLERHLCGDGVAEPASAMLRALMDGEPFDECFAEPLRCEYGLDHARLIAYGRDRGVGEAPRFALDGWATVGAPLDDVYEERQRADVDAFLARVRSDRPAPRRRDRPYGVPSRLPADVRDCL